MSDALIAGANPSDVPPTGRSPAPRNPETPLRRAVRRFMRNRFALTGAVFLAVLFALLALEPFLNPHDSTRLTELQFASPGAGHWLGTDVHGRDLLSRVAYGARISLLVGAVGACVSLVIGVAWGAVAGYVGGRVDGFLMRCVDILYSMPSIVLVIVLITTIEGFFRTWLAGVLSPAWEPVARLLFLFAGLGAVSWLTMARIVRGQVLVLRHKPFVEASRVLGASHARILFRHILPNTTGVIIVYLTLTIPSIILYESFLSYLGLGIQPPQASLGSLLAEGTVQINPLRVYWWMIAFPGAFLSGTLLALNLLGDGLRDALDVRS